MKGIIFDFNGTLYWDSKLHYDAWREYSKILRGYEFTTQEMQEKIDNARKELNKELPPYSQITKVMLQNEEFEKTAKKSIKRYLYQNMIP